MQTTEIIQLIFWIIKTGALALVAKIVFDFLLFITKTIIELRRYKKNIIRKLNLLKSLEIYWLENVNKKEEKGLTDEIYILEKICEGNPKEEIFLNLLKASNISYCYDMYLKISKTKFANLQLRATTEIIKATGKAQ